jgi:hypothetical protein
MKYRNELFCQNVCKRNLDKSDFLCVFCVLMGANVATPLAEI